MISLETHITIATREAYAHGYAGFLIVQELMEDEYSRIFMHNKGELEPARKSMKIQGVEIVEEVWI